MTGLFSIAFLIHFINQSLSQFLLSDTNLSELHLPALPPRSPDALVTDPEDQSLGEFNEAVLPLIERYFDWTARVQSGQDNLFTPRGAHCC